MASGVIKPTLPTSWFKCMPIAVGTLSTIDLDYNGYENLTILLAREGRYAFISFDTWSGVTVLGMNPNNWLTYSVNNKKVKLTSTVSGGTRGMAFYIIDVNIA